MTTLRLDAGGWKDRAAGLGCLLAALGAPDWHGDNLDALADSLRGGINRLDPPLHLTLSGVAAAPAPVQVFVAALQSLFDDLQNEGIDLRLTVL